ncbi:MAG: branched-chain-amino-acid transaminase [Actinomycetota bacterium]|nr:branched-chain-amino-acid transaminase [Solirubrobacterales bacterium]MDQ3091271.1 branched-chain-amino-acid transaminase [Actinomycetota bacterium]MDQ3371642.1 branched-chain-amino-acid transaminase [Actinomycetota bacterium]
MAFVDGDWFADAREASLPVLDHGLLYGDGVFEGIRFYAREPFLLAAHLRRLSASARALMLEARWSDAELESLCREAIARVGLNDGYIRLIVTRGTGALGVSPASCPAPSLVLIAAPLALYPPDVLEHGARVVIASIRRAEPDALPPQVKSLNYLTSVLASIEARARGAHEALLLDARGRIAECSADNVFLVWGGVVRTPAAAHGALRGITRDHVIGLLRADGVAVQEAELVPADAWTADEAFMTGTGAEIVPIASIDERPLQAPGPLTRRTAELFRASLPT